MDGKVSNLAGTDCILPADCKTQGGKLSNDSKTCLSSCPTGKCISL